MSALKYQARQQNSITLKRGYGTEDANERINTGNAKLEGILVDGDMEIVLFPVQRNSGVPARNVSPLFRKSQILPTLVLGKHSSGPVVQRQLLYSFPST